MKPAETTGQEVGYKRERREQRRRYQRLAALTPCWSADYTTNLRVAQSAMNANTSATACCFFPPWTSKCGQCIFRGGAYNGGDEVG